MANTVFKLNYEGVGQLLRSDEIMDVCREYAEEVQGRAGDGYEISEYVGKTRVNVSVYAATKEALEECYEDNALLKALGV
jgi:hypothetical protein